MKLSSEYVIWNWQKKNQAKCSVDEVSWQYHWDILTHVQILESATLIYLTLL